jgi:hypothetical protein
VSIIELDELNESSTNSISTSTSLEALYTLYYPKYPFFHISQVEVNIDSGLQQNRFTSRNYPDGQIYKFGVQPAHPPLAEPAPSVPSPTVTSCVQCIDLSTIAAASTLDSLYAGVCAPVCHVSFVRFDGAAGVLDARQSPSSSV